jgi:hypothetical protein
VQLPFVGLLGGGQHVVAHVPLVTDPRTGVQGVQDSGGVQAVGVVAGAGDRVPDPHQAPVQGTRDLHVHPGGLVLAREQVRVPGPGPARQQGRLDHVHDLLVQVLRGRYELLQYLPQPWGDPGHRPADRRPGHPERLPELGLDPVPPQVGQRHHHRGVRPQDRWPEPLTLPRRDVLQHHTQPIQLILREPSDMTCDRRSVSVRNDLSKKILPRDGPSPTTTPPTPRISLKAAASMHPRDGARIVTAIQSWSRSEPSSTRN